MRNIKTKTARAAAGLPVILAAMALIITACSHPVGSSKIDFVSLIPDGSGTVTTTKLTLTLSQDIEGFGTADITLGGSTGAVKGTLSKQATAGVYELTLTDIAAAGKVTVAVNKSGYAFTPASREVAIYYVPPIPVDFISLTADGGGLANTTKLTLTLSQDIEGLGTADISLAPGSTGAVKDTLSKQAATGVYELTLTGITLAGNVTVTLSKSGYAFTPASREAQINYTPPIPVNFTGLDADGGTGAATTALTITLGQDIEDFDEADITLSGDTGAVKGTLSKQEDGYKLTLTDIANSGPVTVALNKDGYAFSPASRDVPIYYYNPTDVTICFTAPEDEIVDLTVEGDTVFSVTGNSTITISGLDAFDEWDLSMGDNFQLSGAGEAEIRLSAAEIFDHVGALGIYNFVLLCGKDGLFYSKQIKVRLAY
jgi:hypothetical protein